jgi:hypothetical protein
MYSAERRAIDVDLLTAGLAVVDLECRDTAHATNCSLSKPEIEADARDAGSEN